MAAEVRSIFGRFVLAEDAPASFVRWPKAGWFLMLAILSHQRRCSFWQHWPFQDFHALAKIISMILLQVTHNYEKLSMEKLLANARKRHVHLQSNIQQKRFQHAKLLVSTFAPRWRAREQLGQGRNGYRTLDLLGSGGYGQWLSRSHVFDEETRGGVVKHGALLMFVETLLKHAWNWAYLMSINLTLILTMLIIIATIYYIKRSKKVINS